MGQVWSSANFDGIQELGAHGGCGSALAVTAQNLDLPTPINESPARVSLDKNLGKNCEDFDDSVRGFISFHSGGAYFVYGDGSVHFLEETIEPQIYMSLSTIAGKDNVIQ